VGQLSRLRALAVSPQAQPAIRGDGNEFFNDPVADPLASVRGKHRHLGAGTKDQVRCVEVRVTDEAFTMENQNVMPGWISTASKVQPHMLAQWSYSVDTRHFSDESFNAGNLICVKSTFNAHVVR
jgi:hypothetical protein